MKENITKTANTLNIEKTISALIKGKISIQKILSDALNGLNYAYLCLIEIFSDYKLENIKQNILNNHQSLQTIFKIIYENRITNDTSSMSYVLMDFLLKNIEWNNQNEEKYLKQIELILTSTVQFSSWALMNKYTPTKIINKIVLYNNLHSTKKTYLTPEEIRSVINDTKVNQVRKNEAKEILKGIIVNQYYGQPVENVNTVYYLANRLRENQDDPFLIGMAKGNLSIEVSQALGDFGFSDPKYSKLDSSLKNNEDASVQLGYALSGNRTININTMLEKVSHAIDKKKNSNNLQQNEAYDMWNVVYKKIISKDDFISCCFNNYFQNIYMSLKNILEQKIIKDILQIMINMNFSGSEMESLTDSLIVKDVVKESLNDPLLINYAVNLHEDFIKYMLLSESDRNHYYSRKTDSKYIPKKDDDPNQPEEMTEDEINQMILKNLTKNVAKNEDDSVMPFASSINWFKISKVFPK